MSLTSHLRSKESPIRRLFDERLSNIQPVVESMRNRLKRAKTILPPGTYSSYEHMLVGTAFDYRARMYFKKFPLKDTVAYDGARQSDIFGTGFMAYLFKNWVSPNYRFCLNNSGARGTRPKPSVEREFLKVCVLLARYDELARAPSHAIPVYEGPQIRNLEDIANMTRPEYLDDLNKLSGLFFRTFRDRLKQRSILNPTFDGSAHVGGADADLIIGRELVELKCTIDPKLPLDRARQTIFQLVGYCGLDFSNRWRIETVSVYFARQGVVWSMPINSLLTTLSGGRLCAIEELREDLEPAVLRRAA